MERNRPKTIILVPAYNEREEILRKTLDTLRESGFPIVVIDDGSEVELSLYLNGLNGVTVLRHPVNLGQGAALQTGMDYALEVGAEAVVHFDADGQHDAREIPALLDTLTNGADLALGSRFLRKEDKVAIPWARRLLLRGARCVNFLFTGKWLSDAHNGFRALNRKAMEKIRITENRMAHATEIVALARKASLKIVEVPVHIQYTDYSRAKGQNWQQSLNILLELLLNKLF